MFAIPVFVSLPAFKQIFVGYPSRDRQGVITACAVTLPDGRG